MFHTQGMRVEAFWVSASSRLPCCCFTTWVVFVVSSSKVLVLQILRNTQLRLYATWDARWRKVHKYNVLHLFI